MKKNLKIIASIALAIIMMMAVTLSASAQSGTCNVTIDGQQVSFNSSSGYPFIDQNSRTMVPLRITMESYGCQVGWNGVTQTAVVSKGGISVQVPVGADYIIKGDSVIQNDTAAQIVNGRTYLPIRAVLEALGATVQWNATSNTVQVFSATGSGQSTGSSGSYSSSVSFYSDHYGVPDFGKIFGVAPIQHDGDAYIYKLSGLPSNAVSTYVKCLDDNGFSYYSSFVDSENQRIRVYVNPSLNIMISASAEPSLDVVIVLMQNMD